MLGIVAVGSPENFQGTMYGGALRGHLCDSTAFLFFFASHVFSNYACDLLRLFYVITDRRETLHTHTRRMCMHDTRQHSPQSHRDGFST